MNRYLTTYNVHVYLDGSCTVPPASVDGEIDPADCDYPSVQAALGDLFDAVIQDEMPCRVVFNFDRAEHDCDPERTCDKCGRVES